MGDRDGELQAWVSAYVFTDCPCCGVTARANVIIGVRGNVAGRKWLMFWPHYADCDRACVTGEIMGSDLTGLHRGPATCTCGVGLIDYEKPAGITLEELEGTAGK